MTNKHITQTFLNRQPQHIKDEIATRAKTQTIRPIQIWLNEQGINVSYCQVRHYMATNNLIPKLLIIPPVKGHKAKIRLYIGALLDYKMRTYTINNLGMCGSSWAAVTTALHRDGMIEPMRTYSPIRWRILATKDDLREWLKNETRKDDPRNR